MILLKVMRILKMKLYPNLRKEYKNLRKRRDREVIREGLKKSLIDSNTFFSVIECTCLTLIIIY
jgi:hypothetical protein